MSLTRMKAYAYADVISSKIPCIACADSERGAGGPNNHKAIGSGVVPDCINS